MNFNVEVYCANGCLNLKHARGIYQIELSRLDTPKKVYQWTMHLLEKNWTTLEMLRRIVSILEKRFEYDLHEFTDAARRG